MKKIVVFALVAGLILVAARALYTADVYAGSSPDWPQWGRTWEHQNSTHAIGQNPSSQLANVVVDPFVAQEQAESGGARYSTSSGGSDVRPFGYASSCRPLESKTVSLPRAAFSAPLAVEV